MLYANIKKQLLIQVFIFCKFFFEVGHFWIKFWKPTRREDLLLFNANYLRCAELLTVNHFVIRFYFDDFIATAMNSNIPQCLIFSACFM